MVAFPPLPDKKYPVIIADPPWAYANWSDKAHGAARSWYQCLKTKEIAELPVKDVAADNAALLLWITGPKLAEGAHLPLMEAWGFRSVTVAFVWRKLTQQEKPYMGLGFYTRSCIEYVMLGIRGKYPRKAGATSVRQFFEAPRRLHSQKPELFPLHVKSLFDGPYLELFAREEPLWSQDWDIWGDQVPTRG
jgi:N6-adenosine-specific RNA methylase IME4